MSISDYIVAHTLVHERMHRELHESHEPDSQRSPEPAPERPYRIIIARQRLSRALYAAASRIEPRPAGVMTGQTTGTAR